MNRSMLFLTALLLLAGCTTDTLMPETTDGRVPIGISVSDKNNVPTRAGTQIQKSQFDADETIHVYFQNGADVESAQFTTINSLGATEVAASSVQPYFAKEATEVNLHAYYPKTVNQNTTKFGVQQDQTTTENFKKSDLMYAYAKATKSGTAVTAPLQFEHKFAKIVAMVTAGDSVQKIYGIRIVGGYRTVSLTDGMTCALGSKYEDPNSLSDHILMYDNPDGVTEVICAAMLPPQDINEEFIEVVTDNGNYLYTLTKELQGSHTYNIAFTVGATKKTPAEEKPDADGMNYSSNVLAIDPITDNPTYTGEAFTPSVKVRDKQNGYKLLTKDTDYQLAYANNTNAGTATVIAVGIGSYLGEAVSATFNIEKATAEISYDVTSVEKSVIDLRFTNPLTNKGDGVVSYKSSNPDVATVSALTGKVEIKSSGTATITATVADGENYTYSVKSVSYDITVTEFTIAALKNWVNDGNTSTRYYGYYVDKAGNLHADYATGDIGRVAYYAPYDVDASISGSRILVMALNDVGNYVWSSSSIQRSVASESGYSNTKRLQAYGSSHHPAAYAAWRYYADQPDGASNWFLPSTTQWANMMVTAQMSGTGNVGFSLNYWTSNEYDSNWAWAVTAAGNMTNSPKTSVFGVRPCFAY